MAFVDADELNHEFDALVEFGKRSRTDLGFATLDAQGNHDEPAGLQLWINCRMTHVFCLAALRGDDDALSFAQHGVRSLLENFHDRDNGGFFSTLSYDAPATPLDAAGRRKEAYAHAFVLLAASSGMQVGIEKASELFDLAQDAHDRFFWEDKFGLARESWDAEFTETEDYRGANANMHTLEASLAAWDATSDPRWLRKAASILSFVLATAEKLGWRIPEHFDSQWNLLRDFNADKPADPFRPFGVTPGHGIEWSRLALQFAAAVDGLGAPDNEFTSARADIEAKALNLLRTAIADGWNVDGEPGIVYTTTFEGEPVVHERMHWTICEGFAAAAAFASYAQSIDDDELADEMETWRSIFGDFAAKFLIETPGHWIHELDRNNEPSGQTWPGKPDVYHAAQAMLMPQLPLTPCFAGALKNLS